MKIFMTATEARLAGDWTLTGVTRNIGLLSQSLQKLKPGGDRSLLVDCGEIRDADISGLQLLNVWLQCVRFHGMEPILINVPKRLQYTMQMLIGSCVMAACHDTAAMAG